jgi:hypothetical protein
MNLDHPEAFLMSMIDMIRSVDSRSYEYGAYYPIRMGCKSEFDLGVIGMAEKLP